MQKRVEFVLTPEEYVAVANIIGTQKESLEKTAKMVMTGSFSREELSDILLIIVEKLGEMECIINSVTANVN